MYNSSIWIFSATRVMVSVMFLLQLLLSAYSVHSTINTSNLQLKCSKVLTLWITPFCPVDEAWGCNTRRPQAARRHLAVSLPRRLFNVQISAIRLLPVLGRLLAGARRAKRRKVPQLLDLVHRHSL